ncbi:UPF0606 protein KIAA1549 isoform X1 [Phycodurus eques]|uniref:UPF0606 protein KIAA1549 isoform X1 n=1 Tax=Phycodurus eques TaxID=693459 RepID=UPI002ACDF629|nr:UPF0606 protein KIAA1549 isoform X1 [Phycodurus eques]XP_061524389.1 UPF0606 protein KIAA1549 isoform X1 [Phycodurus eques]XP_061524391.1 UPF0606 protein KIAA1549 isoform X1 [Phycodurus eques]XP_061524392.1 UPF0606 protein KIAA1549 isoform X1 [Phycodurus eques]XP_061524393.1 UPF0606 protein KIAA1549 isoform X1 [Phycodurus eques]
MDPVVAAGPRTRMEPRTSEWSLTVLLLVTVMLFSMATSSSPVGGGPEWNRTAGSFSPPSPSSLPLPLRPHAANPESAYRGKRGSLAEDSGAQGIHLLLRPPDLLSPSLSPRLPPHNRPPPAPLSPWEQSNSLEEAWASGDYLETLSFVLPNGEDLALATPLPGHPFDDDDDDDAGGDWALSYEGVLPRRPTPPLDSHVLFSPSTAAPGVPPHTRHARPDVFPAWDDDYDPEDLAPLQPTEILLPDMNSLEYYTNLLAKESVKEGSRPPSGEKHGVRFSQPFVPPTVIHNQSRARPPAVKGEQNSEASPRSAPPPRREPEHPLADPTPWLSLSPSLTSDLEAPTVGPSEPEEKDLFGPSEPPRSSNTTSRVLQPPPLGPPTHLERPYTPAEVTDNPGKSTTHRTAISLTRAPPVTTPRMAQTPPGKQYLCNVSKPELYLVRVGGTRGSVAGFSQVRDLLRREFNRSVELQFLRTPSSFAFRVVSGPLIYTAISVINALRRLSRLSGTVPAVSALYTVPDVRYQVHTLLLFVPAHVDVRVCNFSERVESGLVMAYSETRRRSLESGAVSVQLLNITLNSVRMAGERKLPVDIVFAVRDGRGYLPGYEVSRHLRNLSLVEFSFYVGFPALQIAEPFHYPELNTSHHLRSTWVRTVLLGVPDEIVSERSFKARVERRLASLLEEGLGASGRRRWRRATAAADSSLQVVRVARVSGPKRPLEVLYFVEGPGGTRVPAEETAETLNSLDLQRAAIVLGHQVQRPMAQPVETVSVPPSETQSSSIWLIVGVIVPVLLALFIIILLYWKLCGSEKLEFQPDAINTIQQRQKLQASSVKGFDFAKLHLGQHSKDDIMVIQEAGPPPAPAKEVTPSDGGGLNTPKSKGSSTKTGRTARRRGRTSQSDADSLGSDQSSGRESAEESTRLAATPMEAKQQKKPPKNAPSVGDELMSSSSIFDHVDRLSRGSSDGVRRQAGKVQLIAMQPRASTPARPSPSLSQKVSTEVALRHKSEMEQRRNKLRQRAKRRGQCEFPSMDDIMDAFGDGPVQTEVAQRLYSSAHDHMDYTDCIPRADTPSPPTPTDERRRGRHSPRGRRAPPGPGSLPDTDQDRLLMDQAATYRKYPGLNNVAYMSDPDLPPDHRSPSPADEVFDAALAPPPYAPPRPSIEEARQQMHSLLDDAFALVSPTSRGLSPALPGPLGRQWGSYPAGPSHSPLSARYAELGVSPISGLGAQGHLQRQSSGGFVSSGERLQDHLYSSRGRYKQLPSSSRPRPVGGSTAGLQLQHLTQVGLSSQIAAYPAVGRSASGPTGSCWNERHSARDLSGPVSSRETAPSFAEFSSPSVFQLPSSSLRDASPPPLLLTSPTPEYLPEDASPSAHSSASLIKAIREELRRLAQKQAVTSYP